MMEKIEEFNLFDSIVKASENGVEFDFYGVDFLKFCLSTPGGSRVIFEAIEDESDGYRSYLKTIATCYADDDKSSIFFREPIARVKVSLHRACNTDEDHTDYDTAGYEFRDVDDDHLWLFIGTDYSDDYYPRFQFNYDVPCTRKLGE